MLLDDGSSEKAEIDGRDNEGSTPLTFSVPLGYIEAVRVFLQRGADVNGLDAYQNAPLHWAIAHVPMTRLLLEKGAREEVAKVLIEAGADVNAADENSLTPLHVASLQGLEGIVRLLLAKAARVDVEDVDGWTPLHAAVLRKHDTMASLFVDRTEDGPKIVAQMTELLQGDAVQAMWDEKAQEKSAGSTVVSCLRYAANTGNVEMVLALLESGTDVDAEDDVGGSTALTLAASLCHTDIVQLLLQNGTIVNKSNRNGWTALHYAACSEGGLELVKLLLENGADIEAKVDPQNDPRSINDARPGHESDSGEADTDDYQTGVYGRRNVFRGPDGFPPPPFGEHPLRTSPGDAVAGRGGNAQEPGSSAGGDAEAQRGSWNARLSPLSENARFKEGFERLLASLSNLTPNFDTLSALEQLTRNIGELSLQSIAEAIESLPRKSLDEETLGSQHELTCAICQYDVKIGEMHKVFLSCKHGFHEECVVPWLKESNTCPDCRAVIGDEAAVVQDQVSRRD
ncbi:ankyrin repeat-containing domain protein [Microdochium trichocladiopsis]|uniref:Ankyrin repeat-containing domain protein n=1 Tax=Microdochium trichocladiopsis TaxID=1682393 RepID=A0A9P8XTG0_9PEZI|nr:ankyrin repeat-containing domain protein [Microdochium trichocladiopsis]KAH7016441.1 ankyrin repeat-containing domain protein [Microdochium trichocladiopsis]